MNELPHCPQRVHHLVSEKHVYTIDGDANKEEMCNLKERKTNYTYRDFERVSHTRQNLEFEE